LETYHAPRATQSLHAVNWATGTGGVGGRTV